MWKTWNWNKERFTPLQRKQYRPDPHYRERLRENRRKHKEWRMRRHMRDGVLL